MTDDRGPSLGRRTIFGAVPALLAGNVGLGPSALDAALQDPASPRPMNAPAEIISPTLFGSRGDGVADDWPAFSAAIDTIRKSIKNPDEYYAGGGRLFIPAGTYRLSRPLEIVDMTLIIEGEGTGMAGGRPTILNFPENSAGIIIRRFSQPGAGGSFRRGGDGTIVRQLALEGKGGKGPYNGILAHARCRVEDVVISNFAGHGIAIEASLNATGERNGNANGWQVNTARLGRNGGSGLFVAGADTNAGLGIAIDATSNGGWGIEDNSFLGNTYIACQTEQNTAGAYRCSSRNARNQFLGCYSEPDQPPSEISYPAIVWGGLHGAGIKGDGVVLDNRLGALTVTGGMYTSGGIGVGNSEPATRPQQVVRRMRVYDQSGRPIGFVPIYDRID